MLKKILITSCLLFSTFLVSSEKDVEASGVDKTPYTYFKDVPANSSHASNIYTLYRMGIINGYEDNLYGTSNNVSREHIVAIMYRLMKDKSVIIRPAKSFKDVPKTHTYYNEITWAYQVGMIDGSGDYFNPKSFMTREQMSKILVNGFSFETNKYYYSFKDVSTNNWSYEFVNALYTNGITQLVDSKYNPKNNVTRGQLASFLVRSLEKETKYNIGINFVREVPKETVRVASTTPVVNTNAMSYESGYGFKWFAEVGQKTLKLNGVDSKNNVVANFVKGKGLALEGVTIGVERKDVERKFNSYKTNYISYKDGDYSIEVFNKEIFVFKRNNKVIHVFFDLHNNNRVTSILVINESVYKKKNYYSTGTTSIRNSYEALMPLLINQSRKENGLAPLVDTNNKYISLARNHSVDMITRGYFAHESPDKKSTVSSRMTKANIPDLSHFGENIAYGQETVLHAHEALMNSLGHRQNILSKNFAYVVNGVAFTNENTPYYTVNFYNVYK